MLQQRPPLFGPEKPPHEKKKMYHYYCNKIYKAHSIHNLFRQCQLLWTVQFFLWLGQVIRFANPDGVEMAPTSWRLNLL